MQKTIRKGTKLGKIPATRNRGINIGNKPVSNRGNSKMVKVDKNKNIGEGRNPSKVDDNKIAEEAMAHLLNMRRKRSTVVKVERSATVKGQSSAGVKGEKGHRGQHRNINIHSSHKKKHRRKRLEERTKDMQAR
eukprot:UN28417